MVNIIIKGVSPKGRFSDKPTYEITRLKAGVTLRDKGGLFLTISDMKLSKELKEFFDKYETGFLGRTNVLRKELKEFFDKRK